MFTFHQKSPRNLEVFSWCDVWKKKKVENPNYLQFISSENL